MAEIMLFPVPPRRFRVIEAKEIGVILPFPQQVSERRMDRLLGQEIARVLQERLERHRRWQNDELPHW